MSQDKASDEAPSEATVDIDVQVGFHMGLAEQGKVHALQGDQRLAMLYYREAMRLAVAKKAPEVFFRHYLECTIESLERSGANEEVLRYCTKALEHHRGLKPVDAAQAQLIANDKATTLQRRGVTLLRMGRTEEAREALREATQLARAQGLSLPVADTLFGWVARGFRVEARRLEQELERHQYYGVRADTVHPERAIRLPASHLAGLAPGL